MPPSQIMKPRHRFTEGGSLSRPESTVAPLAVSPETASKYASVKRRPGRLKSSGSVAKAGSTVHTRATNRKPSRTCSSRRSWKVMSHSASAAMRVAAIEWPKA